MECITQNIHMDVLRCKIESQFTLEQDCNVADSKPDLTHILLSDAFIKLEEVRPGTDEVTLRGKLCYRLLYSSEDCFGSLHTLQGKIPFEECLHVPGLNVADHPMIAIELEHLQIHPINSRKINVRALLLVNGAMEDISDATLCYDLNDCREEMQLHHADQNVLNLNVMKKEICRIREEAKLTAPLPDLKEILWEQTQVCNLNFQPTDDKLCIKGELSLFLLYLSADERENIECFETIIPFHSTLDCTGCKDGLIPHISYSVSQKGFEILPDADGLERIIGVDLVLDLNIKLYEEVALSLIDDLYGIQSELTPVYNTYQVKKLFSNTIAQMRYDKDFTLNHSDNILQVKCTKATLCLQHCTPGADGLEMEGYLALQILCVTDDDRFPYRIQKAEIPFNYCVAANGSLDKILYEISANLESCQVTPTSGDAFTLKCRASFDVFAYSEEELSSLSEVKVFSYPKQVTDSIAGISVYYVSEGSTLWEIGKDSLTPLQKIRELNTLSSDALIPGQKLLIMR